MGFSFSYDFYKNTKFLKEIVGTTECFNIIRSTMKYAIKTPFYGLLISTQFILSLICVDNSLYYFEKFYSNIKERKMIENDN